MKKIIICFSLLLSLFPTLTLAQETDLQDQQTPINDAAVCEVTTKEEFETALTAQCGEIKFLNDIDFNEIALPYTVNNKVINLNGFTVTSKLYQGDKPFALSFCLEGSNFTLKNGTIKSDADYPLFLGDAPSENILIENMVIDGGINIYACKDVTIKNSDVNASAKNYYALWADNNTTNIVVESGSFTSGEGATIGGTVETGETKIVVNGGTFYAKDNKEIVLDNGKGDYTVPQFNAGSFNKKPNQGVDSNTALIEVNGMYSAGETAIDVIQNSEPGTTINIEQGIDNIDGVKPGVIINNNQESDITINGNVVTSGDEIIVPETPTVENEKLSTNQPSGYDDGGPFTTDACGNVFDRWGNEIYHAPVCLNDVSQQQSNEYTLVNTSDK